MNRVSVVGSSGAGKTTVSRTLADRLRAPWIELDALFWEPGWRQAAEDVFRERVRAVAAGERWVIDGNYSVARDIVLPRADTLVWLDLPYRTVVARTVRRTFARMRTREPLWNGNVESWRKSIGPDSLIWWVIRTHLGRRRRWERDLRRPEYGHLALVRLRTPAEVDGWLASVAG